MKRPLLAVSLFLVIVAWIKLMSGGYDSFDNSFPDDGCRVVIRGQVCQKENQKIWIDSVNILSFDETYQRAGSLHPINSYPKKIICDIENASDIRLGSVVVVSGNYRSISRATNPGEFDYGIYYRSLGATGRLQNAQLLKQSKDYWFVREAAFCISRALQERLYEVMPQKEAGVMVALLLGNKGEMDSVMKDLYKRNGILHILSISSLHITILGMSLYRLLRKAGLPVVLSAILGSFVLLFYGAMTGFGISTCRAIGMYLIRMFAKVCGKTYDMLTALGCLAAGMVLSNPYYLQNAGFLLSFSAVAGIGAFYPIFSKGQAPVTERYFSEAKYRVWVRRLIKRVVEAVLANVSILALTLPIQLWFYYEVPVFSLLINPIILPFVKPLLIAGFLCLIPGFQAAGLLDQAILKLFEGICQLTDHLPIQTWNPGRPRVWQLVLYYGILLGLLVYQNVRKRRNFRVRKERYRIGKKTMPIRCRKEREEHQSRIGCLFLLCIAVMILVFPQPKENRVIFLDVGQGDCCLIQTDAGENFLVDCGSSSRNRIGQSVLLPCLKYYGITVLDGVFLTHPDTDHMNGLLELMELAGENRISIRELLLPSIAETAGTSAFSEILKAYDKAFQGPVRRILAGDERRLSCGRLLCLHPQKDDSTENSNEYSICIYAELDGNSLLLTGDVEGTGEEKLIETLRKMDIPAVTILKCAHHGSNKTTSGMFLERIRPEVTVISCGKKNRYGHPHEETLKRLESVGSRILRTDEEGAIIVKLKQKKASIVTYPISGQEQNKAD